MTRWEIYCSIYVSEPHRGVCGSMRLLYSTTRALRRFMGECTPDISKLDCGKCLDVAMNSITIHASGQLGASMVRYSCVLRFDTYKFFQPTADAPPPPCSTPAPPVPQSPPPLSTDTSDSSNKFRTIITTTASDMLTVVLLCLFLRLRKRKHNINVESKFGTNCDSKAKKMI
ncbi:hypothetical protein RJ639_027072 [Escallonia herrerae]|uniref:Gnk2-homologous domain-containing protein n=1 Tax=Escallonia herrerae TaxID=1293975 RepID=A0AA88X561_9ASTE|nr:hypothetical protein RJ639_027072 [Escallonia herrerae]